MHCQHFCIRKIDLRCRNGIVQRLLRLHSVKFEEFRGCGRETEPAGDDGRYIARNLQANCQFSDGPWTRSGRVRASIERTGQATCDLSTRSQKHISWMYAT
ncbi:hypothetical protein ALC62_05885 [Cyphomyrmex costatus]|uniref:Uncharacterized protein n=1 Tax=Cyphomyrmex costatus TaxID=456900 RepID=A0A195CRV1_9HYME|nr:hypothetical protein ALC62_05885 [Cyphomyrmex costatus]